MLRSLPLERFGLLQAVVVLVACPFVALAGSAWPLSLAAALGLAPLLVAWRGRYTARGSFGSANGVTALRLAGVLVLAARGEAWSWRVIVPLALGLFALDGVDGLLARRSHLASDFGAHFDVEVDALLVLVLGSVLWQSERFGAWIVWSGLLRYLYVLALAAAPARGQEPRSRLGRLAFTAVVFGLLAAFVDRGDAGTAAAVVGTVLVTLSFGRSFYFSYGRSAR